MTVWHCDVRSANQRTQPLDKVTKISVVATNMEGKVPRISGREAGGGYHHYEAVLYSVSSSACVSQFCQGATMTTRYGC